MPTAFPQMPYGWADFEAMRLERCLYVDERRFPHEVEKVRYAFLIRPRRFGKSCWVSLLENYYDRNREDRFERLGCSRTLRWPRSVGRRIRSGRGRCDGPDR